MLHWSEKREIFDRLSWHDETRGGSSRKIYHRYVNWLVTMPNPYSAPIALVAYGAGNAYSLKGTELGHALPILR